LVPGVADAVLSLAVLLGYATIGLVVTCPAVHPTAVR
jgi:hypothetical protein